MRPTWEKSQAARFPSAGHWSSPPIGPLARTQLNSPNPRAPQGHGYACVHYSLSAAQVSAVYLKSSPAGLFTGLSKSSNSVWIASRSRKLSDRSSAEGRCASAPSGCGCVPCRHGVQSVLPGG
jgi:hypothetical protein